MNKLLIVIMAETQRMTVYGRHPPCANGSRLDERRAKR